MVEGFILNYAFQFYRGNKNLIRDMVFDSQHNTATFGTIVTAIDSKASRQDLIVKKVVVRGTLFELRFIDYYSLK